MNISLNWLRDYVDIPVDPEELVKRFTMIGLKVEHAGPAPLEAAGVVSARVLDIARHPERPQLKVGRLTDGTSTFSVVSGAPGLERGKVVALAVPGSVLPGGVTVGVREFDSVVSHGMVVCSNEVLTGGPHRQDEDIIILPESAPLGKPIQDLLGLDDYLIELELTVNYSHCLSVLGVAIECCAMFGVPLKLPDTLRDWDWAGPRGSKPPHDGVEVQGEEEFTVDLPDIDLCPRYVGKSVIGHGFGYSPISVERRLLLAGMRPINAVVDATNYVMLETGQPLHAFDRDLLSGKVISARRSQKGERIKTLDGEEREISEGTLIIADASGPIAIAGVMGGANTEVSSKTRSILIESAYFDPRAVRTASQRLRLRTEAAIRFEKGLDPTMQAAVAERAARFVADMVGGRIVRGIAQKNCLTNIPRRLTLTTQSAKRYLGIGLDPKEYGGILRALRFGVVDEDPSRGSVTVEVPPRRVDVEEEVDLIEEVARHRGYDSFGDAPLSKAVAGGPPNRHFVVRDRIRDFLVQVGGREVVSSSLLCEDDVKPLGWAPEDPRSNPIPLMKALTSSETSLRTSLLPGLIKIMRHNQKQKAPGMFIWETGTVFFKGGEELPLEFSQLAMASYGTLREKAWLQEELTASFYQMKGAVEELLELAGIGCAVFFPGCGMPFHPGRSARVIVKGTAIGELGEIHPKVLRDTGLSGPVVMAWFSMDALLALSNDSAYQGVPRFMPLERDLAVVVPEEVPAGDVEREVMENSRYLREVTLFDIYRGSPVPPGMKSLAMRLRYQPVERTLTEEDLTTDRDHILQALSKKFGAHQRV